MIELMSRRRSRFIAAVAVACFAPMLHGCNKSDGESAEAEMPRVGFDVWTKYAGTPDRIAQLMQPRTSAAKTFQPTLSDESTRIFDKLKNTAQVDPQLFLHLVRDGMVDGLPIYDPRFGITREEYNLLMRGTHLRLKEISDAAVQITAGSEGSYVIRGLPGLSEVVVDAALQAVTTPYGEVTRPTEFETAASPQLTGPLAGYRWTEPTVAGGLRRYRIHEFTLAQSKTDGAVWIIAQIADTIDNRLLVDYFARFDGPLAAE